MGTRVRETKSTHAAAALALAMALCLAGCTRFVDPPSAKAQDGQPASEGGISAADLQPLDAPTTDQSAVDSGRPDATSDAVGDTASDTRADAATDRTLPSPDASAPPIDIGPSPADVLVVLLDTGPDLTADLTADLGPDLTADLGPDRGPDLSVDLGPTGTGGCSDKARSIGEVSGIVSCETAARVGENQCTAETLCNGTTHQLCPAVDYQAVFGSAAPPSALQSAWLAGCVYRGGVNDAWLDVICGTCSISVWLATDCYWHCGSPSGYCPARRDVGLISGANCVHAGINNSAHAAYWTGSAADSRHARSLCCPMPR